MKKFLLLLFTAVLAAPFTAFAGGSGDEEEGRRRTAAQASGDAVTVLNNQGITGRFPNQFELAEFESLTGEPLELKGNPMFEGSAADRLPDEPLVQVPYEQIGRYGGTLRALSRAPESGTSGVLSWRHANLVRFADDFKTVVPDVAKSWEWNADKTRLTFQLRRGHKWSDGEPFTSADILFWWEDIRANLDYSGTVGAIWTFGGEPMRVSAPDDYTVEFSFASPSPGILLTFATEYIQPFQPKHFLKQFHADYNPDADRLAEELGYDDWKALFNVYYNDWKDSYHPLSGKRPLVVPTLESHVLDEETTEYRILKANPYYHAVDTAGNQLPYTEGIYEVFIQDEELANLKVVSGEVDFKSQGLRLVNYPLLKESESAGGYRVIMAPTSTVMVVLGFNITHKEPVMREIFSDMRFKEAMSIALDRNEINQVVYLGQGQPMQVTPAEPGLVDFVTDDMINRMIEHDPSRAMQLLDEMGLKKGRDGFRVRPDGRPLIISISYSTQGAPAALMQLVKEYWDAVGVRTELKEVNSDLYWTIVRDNNDHDVGVWRTLGNTPPALYTDLPFIPPFLHVYVGNPWEKWMLTGGKEGEEPPRYVKTLIEKTEQFKMEEFGSAAYNRLGEEMSRIHVDNLLRIGTVGKVGQPVVVHSRLRNVPEMNFVSSDYYYAYPFRAPQWFIEE